MFIRAIQCQEFRTVRTGISLRKKTERFWIQTWFICLHGKIWSRGEFHEEKMSRSFLSLSKTTFCAQVFQCQLWCFWLVWWSHHGKLCLSEVPEVLPLLPWRSFKLQHFPGQDVQICRNIGTRCLHKYMPHSYIIYLNFILLALLFRWTKEMWISLV